jgi:hypothetical protein
MGNILITNKTDTHLLSDNTDHIDIHLDEGKYVNIVTANKKYIVMVENGSISVYDESDTFLNGIELGE